MGFRIVGTGSSLPARCVTNEELSTFLDTSDEWISKRTGIHARHICTTESLGDLAVQASQQALDAANSTADELDAIICTTISPDHIMPAEASVIQDRLGAHCPSFDINVACAGFVFALDIADGLFARKRARRVLIVSAERCSHILDWSDRATCVLFGDGAAAAVLDADGQGLLSLRLSTQPDLISLRLPGAPGSCPFDEGAHEAQQLSMHGREIFKFGVTAIDREVRALVRDAKLPVEDIDHFVFHQANGRILDAAAARLGIERDRVVTTLAETGNISSACIPYALDTLVRSGRLVAGQTVALVGFGAGLSVGSCLMRWDEKSACSAPAHPASLRSESVCQESVHPEATRP